jgi:hypothetical protein
VSADWLNNSSCEDQLVAGDSLRTDDVPDGGSHKASIGGSRSTLDQLVLGDDEISDAESVASGRLAGPPPTNVKDVAERIEMCSTSKCPGCNNLLYDEEIMAGWATDDSNFNTSCAFCSKQFLAKLFITVHDYRHVRKPKNIVTKASTESLLGESMISGALDCSCDTLTASLNQSMDQSTAASDSTAALDSNIEDEDNVLRYQLSVPYLSPIVLRKEIEMMIEQDGEECMNTSKFVDNHRDIFWNLVWYFKRLNLPSHIEGYVLTAKSLNYQALSPACWNAANRCHVTVHALWDSLHTHEEFGPPMYVQWRYGSKLLKPSGDDAVMFSKNLMQQIVSSIMCNNVQVPIEKVLAERSSTKGHRSRKNKMAASQRSIYREILFLTLVSLGRENIDIDAYDREFRTTLQSLKKQVLENLRHADRPPDATSVWCRKLFGDLELL